MSKIASVLTDEQFEADQERKRAAAAELAVRTAPAKHKSFARTAARVIANQKIEAANRAKAEAEHDQQKRAAQRAERLQAKLGETKPPVIDKPGVPAPVIAYTRPSTGGIFHPTEYQQRVLAVPEVYSLILAGARGTGKSVAMQQVVIRHLALHGAAAKVLIVRTHLRSLGETENEMRLAFAQAYPTGVRFDGQNHLARLPTGATCEFSPLSDPTDWAKLQGRNFTLVCVEEAGLFSPRQWIWLRMLFSNLRSGSVPCRAIITGNPGGPGHSQLASLIRGHMPWHPFERDGMQWVWCHAGWGANPHIDLVSYEKRLAAACGHDKALLTAWREGLWDGIARGAFFADVIDPTKQMIQGSGGITLPDGRCYSHLSGDWGLSSPATMFACARMLREYGRYPKGSLILLDEFSTADPADDSWSTGLGFSPSRYGDGVAEMCDRTGCRREGVVDDSRGLTESLIEILRKPPLNLFLSPPQKRRRDGWAAMREMLHNSKEANGRPGLWISDRCRGWWATVPSLPRDELHPEDVDTSAVDHWADGCRYAVTHVPTFVTTGRLRGM